MMLKVLAILAIGLTLSGCATLTIATIGVAVGLGVASGVGRFAGERVAKGAYKRHIAYRRCHHIVDQHELIRCVQRYVTPKEID